MVLGVPILKHFSVFLACTPGVGVGIGSELAKSLTLKFFYGMGKALSGKLSCPCDRSCFYCFRFSSFRSFGLGIYFEPDEFLIILNSVCD